MEALEPWDRGVPGLRLDEIAPIAALLSPEGNIGAVAASVLGPQARPVRAILFDKNENKNWALGWHQDRTIAVQTRVELPGFGPWTVKAGIPHVEPPFGLIERMITLRAHLDSVGMNNAPLLVSPGTHALGKIREAEIDEVVAAHGVQACLAEAGDIWVYRTPILHASERSTSQARRRVLQIDFSAEELPAPLVWHLNS